MCPIYGLQKKKIQIYGNLGNPWAGLDTYGLWTITVAHRLMCLEYGKYHYIRYTREMLHIYMMPRSGSAWAAKRARLL